ncbi:uncharacterized protein LOC126234891 [Schistocerca nitens]|uniref:uncharacterized protein LOC126234891 n=1 Tax=Schistocerca nitens TaxID=7011 RepID=UPI0021195190|nr:uncharacterized protein LOC126234891 [Schistocerca nitens]
MTLSDSPISHVASSDFIHSSSAEVITPAYTAAPPPPPLTPSPPPSPMSELHQPAASSAPTAVPLPPLSSLQLNPEAEAPATIIPEPTTYAKAVAAPVTSASASTPLNPGKKTKKSRSKSRPTPPSISSNTPPSNDPCNPPRTDTISISDTQLMAHKPHTPKPLE